MDEHCTDCPWFDQEKQTCRRKPPRLCDVDAPYDISTEPAIAGTALTDEPSA